VTQTARVLAALRQHPDRGITRVDFLRFPTIDGGPPIINIPARILELRDAGHPITDAGTRDKCRVYRLEQQAPEGQLFDLKPRSTIYDTEDAA
jgi:hypothetical protein